MIVRIHSDLAIAFSSTFYAVYKPEIYQWIKSIEYMTLSEFKTKYNNKNFIEFEYNKKHIRITFERIEGTIYLDFITVL